MMDDNEPDKLVPKWEIEPHPYDPHQYDVLWVDTDEEAHAAILYAAEMHLWDSCEPGEERTLTVRHLRGVTGK